MRSDRTALKVPLPHDAQIEGVTGGQRVVTLQDAWTVDGRKIGQGALIAYPVTAFARTGAAQAVSVLYTPFPAAGWRHAVGAPLACGANPTGHV